MENKLNNILSISDFEKNWKPEEAKKTKRTEVGLDVIKENKEDGFHSLPILDTTYDPLEIYKLNKLHKKRYAEEPEYKDRYDKELERSRKSKAEVDAENARRRNFQNQNDEKINRFSDFQKEEDDEEISIAEAAKTKYEFLGKEEDPKSDPNFGYAAVRDQEIKKIAFFNNFVIDPPTPKERPILNAGQFIDNDIVKGYVNRIEGKDVYIESLDEPMVIKKFSLKDAVKIKKDK